MDAGGRATQEAKAEGWGEGTQSIKAKACCRFIRDPDDYARARPAVTWQYPLTPCGMRPYRVVLPTWV